MLVTYTISTYVKTEKITMTPKTLSFCCSHWGVECKKKIAYTRLSLSLSLSLSPPLEKRARGEVRGSWPWLGPTTPAVISSHPGYHMPIFSGIILCCVPYRVPRCRAYWTLNFFFLVHNILYFQITTLCTDEGHIEERFWVIFFFSLDNHPLS